jgi:hypothetical protein
MKVYLEDENGRRLIGRAELPSDHGPVLEVALFGPTSIIRERFTVSTVTLVPPGGGLPIVERAVLVAPGQPAELLPGWQPLAS